MYYQGDFRRRPLRQKLREERMFRRPSITTGLFAPLVSVGLSGWNSARADALKDGQDAWDAGKFAKAMELLLPLAKEGNPKAQYRVGVMHAGGQAVSTDQREAIKWWLLSAAQGNADAQFALGKEYAIGGFGGGGIERDPPEAYFWLTLASESYKATNKSAFDSATQMRDLVAGKLTPEQLAKVEKRLADWRAAH
jgi:TPR repeat protein